MAISAIGKSEVRNWAAYWLRAVRLEKMSREGLPEKVTLEFLAEKGNIFLVKTFYK